MAIFSSFPIRELTSMMAPMFVTSLVVLTAPSPLESETRKKMSMEKRKKKFIIVLPIMKGKAILGFDNPTQNRNKLKALIYGHG